MSLPTAVHLFEWLVERQFLQPAQADKIRPQLYTFADAHGLAKELLRRDWLTPFQVNQILNDKGEALVLGDYRLLERLGEGAMGQVFKAWNLRLHRITAVKTIHSEQLASPKAMERFRREMQTASQLDHPNIVLVRDADQVDKRPFLVMDYFEGKDLSRQVKQGGPLPVPVAAEYIRQAALGLQHAFERGVVHRDIKPGNLLVTRDANQKPVVKILDFGLARFDAGDEENRLTQIGNILGTVDYIAPEQAENARLADVRSDIYGLGCSFYYLLAGRPPFPGSSVVEKISARLVGPPPRLSASRPEIPAELETILAHMLARNPDDRFQTPWEVAQALAPFAQELSAAPGAQPVAVPAPVPGKRIPPSTYEGSPPKAATAIPAAEANGGDPFVFDQDTRLPEEVVQLVTPSSPRLKSVSQAPRPWSNRHWWLIGGGAFLTIGILVLLILLLIGQNSPAKMHKKSYPADASVVVLAPAPLVVERGGVKSLVVTIQRSHFSGPVTLEFKDLPEYFFAEPIVIPEKKDQGEMRLSISFPPQSMKADLRLVAVAENLHHETVLSVTVNRPRDKTK